MLINRRLGEYVLLQRLAVGGQSEVFLAIKEGPGEFHRPVVIKALPTEYRHDPEFVDFFHREAFLSARFSHPHLITVHDARILDAEHCMIMDFISGQTVADIAQRGYKAGQPPTIDQSVRIVADAADGLDYAHHFQALDDTEYSVVHRDVSPQNLMVTYQGTTLVFDFGIAKIMGRDDETEILAGGKYAYMSPEQCRGDEVDPRSDIFSLGIILYELAAGTRLFRRPSRDDVIEAVTSADIDPPSEVDSEIPGELNEIIMKALERAPDDRYQRASEMRDELRDFLSIRAGGTGREEFGNYVADLFEEEREQIAELITRAHKSDKEPRGRDGVPLEKLGRDDVDLEAEEGIEVPMPEPESDEELAERVADEASDRQGENAMPDSSEEGAGLEEDSSDSSKTRSEEEDSDDANPSNNTSSEETSSQTDDDASPACEEIRPPDDEDDAEFLWERYDVAKELEEARQRNATLKIALGVVGTLLVVSLALLIYFEWIQPDGPRQQSKSIEISSTFPE